MDNNLIADQQLVGQKYAENGDYSMLAKLYGLTNEQLAKLQKKSSSGGGAGTVSYRTWLANLSNRDRKTLKEAGVI